MDEEFNVALCQLLGLDPGTVAGIEIEAWAGHEPQIKVWHRTPAVITGQVEVKMYTVMPLEMI